MSFNPNFVFDSSETRTSSRSWLLDCLFVVAENEDPLDREVYRSGRVVDKYTGA